MFSIKRTVLKKFKSSLSNVPYNLKTGGLNIYKTSTYNRELRVIQFPTMNMDRLPFYEAKVLFSEGRGRM